MARPRSQASLAVSADGDRWLLLNASPDLRQQIETTPALHPRYGLRSSPIAGVVLTGADVDALAGLLTLRERHAFAVYATAEIHDLLDANPIFEVLARNLVARRRVPLDTRLELGGGEGRPSGLTLELFGVPGKVPLYLEEEGEEPPIVIGGHNVGVEIAGRSGRLCFIPGCTEVGPALRARLQGCAAVFFDGTLWRDDEMIRAGLGTKTGRRMGHISMSGENGAIAALAGIDIGRRIFLHINNSNPVLLADSAERRAAEAAGWEIAEDGMEVAL